MNKALQIRIKGIVQGVGFRPFVLRSARLFGICGHVINDTEGVLIHAEGDAGSLDQFILCLREEHPPLARIYSMDATEASFSAVEFFTIGRSGVSDDRSAFYAPDAAVCQDCLNELLNPADRRYLYPFISCINCGPRFSIVNATPYDRANTAMNKFVMCAECAAEYSDPDDRRFHSQPNACPVCGPRISLHAADGELLTADYIETAERSAQLLSEGCILAIKGIGGYHLACDARNETAVQKLRVRKCRPTKPFAMMASSIGIVKKYYTISQTEAELLESSVRPIILLDVTCSPAADSVAPGLTNHGIMLPAAPLHYSIFEFFEGDLLVMTSGNLSDEPIVYDDSDAFSRFIGIADYIVAYNREITAQSDDSILFSMNSRNFSIRRARGYVPIPFSSSKTIRKIFAAGADMKTSFALARADFILAGQYIGDMSDPLTIEIYKKSAEKIMRIFDCIPDTVVCDAHPEYFTSTYCEENYSGRAEIIKIQHHHAHIASVLEDNGRSNRVIGLAFDGTGYGTDGKLWGGEFLLADKKKFERAATFSYFPLPGGESAIRDVWKTGLALLRCAQISDHRLLAPGADVSLVLKALEMNINAPLSCSIGRLFDGVASIIGIADHARYEAEAAILLEEAARRSTNRLKFDGISMTDNAGVAIISSADIINRIHESLKMGASKEDAALLFHNLIISAAVATAEKLSRESGIKTIALSGGSFQNRILLKGIWGGLVSVGFEVLLPRRVPFNDGCIALGQIAVVKEMQNTEYLPRCIL